MEDEARADTEMGRIDIATHLMLVLVAMLAFGGNGQLLQPPYTCTTTVCQPGQGGVGLHQAGGDSGEGIVSQAIPGKRGPIGPKGEKGDPCQCDIADEEAMMALRMECNNMREDYESLKRRMETLEGNIQFLPENCTAYVSGPTYVVTDYDVVPIYPLKFIGDISPHMTNCTKIFTEGNDGWIAIQRRMDGGTDFYRNWDSYVRGFGDRQGEFWIGLTNLHLMTSKRTCKLRVDFKDWDKSTSYAEYSTFQVGDESSLFVLAISGYSGNIRDSMAHHNGRKFSTFDRDNDDHGTPCAERYKGAWWYGACHHSNLNGQYFKTAVSDNTGVWWSGFSNSLPFVEMKLHCV